MQSEPAPPTIRQQQAARPPSDTLLSRLIGPTKVSIPTWGILPLRVFLGITFIYAGLDKVTSSTFFNPNGGPQYIGNQLQFAASNSALLGGLLSSVVVPNAVFFGWFIALAEIWIGLATLVGVFTRLTAVLGAILSATLWLSLSGGLSQYYLDSDPIYFFAWITMILIGWGSYGLDSLLIREEKKEALLDQIAKGVTYKDAQDAARNARGPINPRFSLSMITSRRTILRVFGAAAVVAVGEVLALGLRAASGASSAPSANPGTTSTGGGGGAGSNANVIGNAKNIPLNSAATFNVATNNDPGVLIHLPNDQFVAYDAVCTHAGCTVSYNPGSKHLECPCHGSVFDPTKTGTVLAGPAKQPLANIKITIDKGTGAITQG
ncbi:MAG TPA: TQO small subunit DoxD [Ktedonobacterales bacterium]|nr:TQO small subunit DoxD [Ktedonobacterales bacterium]